MPPPLQVNWSGHDLDFRPLTLWKTFSAMVIHVRNICGKFHYKSSTQCRDITSRDNRPTDGQTDVRPEDITPLTPVVGGYKSVTKDSAVRSHSPSTKSWLTSGDDVADGNRTSPPANTPCCAILNRTRPPPGDKGSVWLVKDPSPWSSDRTAHWPCRWTCTECHTPSDTSTAGSETSLSPDWPTSTPRWYRKRSTPSTICTNTTHRCWPQSIINNTAFSVMSTLVDN